MLCTIPHGLEFNITNQFWKHSACTLQPCRKACPTSSLWLIFSSTPGSPHPSGFKLDPLPDPNPRTSLHLSLPPPNGKKNTTSLSLLCFPSPTGMVSRLCDVVRYCGVVWFHGVHQGTFSGPLSCFSFCLPCSLVSVDVVVVVHGLPWYRTWVIF